MSGCNDEVDHSQFEKRKSIEEAAAMGDVLGKDSSSKANLDKDASENQDQEDEDGREEADGAPAELFTSKSTPNRQTNVNQNSTTRENSGKDDLDEVVDIEVEELSSGKNDQEIDTDGVSDMLVIPNSPLRRPKGPCCCDACKDRRELLTEQLEEVTRLQGLWMELRQHIRSVFRAATDTSRISHSSRPKYDKAHLENMHEIILQLCKRDPHQLFMRLEGQAQDFVVETKVRLLDLLHNRNASNLAEIFLTGLLDGYDALLSAASHLSSLVEPLENEHLSKFNLTWDCLNKRLYQSCVYTDPLVQNNLPPFIGQLRKLLPLKGAEYQGLVHRYLAFDDEMTRIGDMWPEAERLIDKYNQEQAALKAKQKMLREDWELFKARRKLIQQRMWNRSSNELSEFDEQLLTLATLGAVGALSPNSRPPSPNSDLGLDALNLPLDSDILESLAQDANKSTHLRLADMVGALTSSEVLTEINGHNVGPPTPMNGHCNEPEYWFGYECAVNHVLNYGFVTPPPSPRSGSPSNDERGDGEGSEGEVGGGEEQTCECHVCTVPRTSPTRIGKGPPLNLNLHTNNLNPFLPISNGSSGGGICTAIKNGTVDMNGVYPHLYNLHTAFAAGPEKPNNVSVSDTSKVKSSASKSDEKKVCPFGPQTKKKSEDLDIKKKKQLDDNHNDGTDDTDLRDTEPQPCPCVYQHAKEIVERKKEVLENPPCSCLLKSKQKWDTCPCLQKSRSDPAITNGYGQPESPVISNTKSTSAGRKAANKPGANQPNHIQTRHSTTQTPNVAHNHNHLPHPGPTHAHSHGPLPDPVRGTVNSHRGHNHPNHVPHACHKQANIEHIKRVSCTDLGAGDGDCSDSGSSQEDSCSTSSSTPRDSSRHCDCCYCEVFGHGVPSVAPVSRNYNEMRERLRQLLTKKKAKKCKAACSPPKTPVEASSSNSTASTNSANTLPNQSVPRPNTPVSVASIQQQDMRDQRDLEALLEFIEGNQNGKKDNKKAEKKARQKQKKLDEKLKKDKQEAEKLRIIELQKKTPEVTITVVDPQKPILQRLLPQRTLPEVSILPASAPLVSSVSGQLNKKKEKDNISNHVTKAKAPLLQSNQKTKNANNVERRDEVFATNQKTKASASTDKVDGIKNSTSTSTKTLEEKTEKKCKKERQKLKREAKAKEEAMLKESEKLKNQPENQPQIVTIKRVMESNSAEPTVTITLKGQTPAEDKVLFTLVNGQTKEPTSSKTDQSQSQKTSGKKKKNKGNNNQQQQQQHQMKFNPVQQSSSGTNGKQQLTNNDSKNNKIQQGNEKSKPGKQNDEKNVGSKQQSQQNLSEIKTTKSKKDKKNLENKENLNQQQNVTNKGKNQQQSSGNNKKLQSKVNTLPETTTSSVQKQQQQNSTNESSSNSKKAKGQSQEKNNQTGVNKYKNNNGNENGVKGKNNIHKNQNNTNHQSLAKSSSITAANEAQNTAAERISSSSSSSSSPLSNQFKDIGANSKINIENLKLPPGITITKVNAPTKPMPIRSAPLPKPVNPPKQTTIIAAPMSGVQSNYASPQGGGNVIVVDTGKLKQDLLPKSNDKDSSKDNQPNQSTNGKKKKKKNNSNNKASTNASAMGNTNASQNNSMANGVSMTNGHSDESARILHNPGSNMVTIRNPAFGPPKMEPTQQAAIIKVSENGMVTIRSPALQQAINAGLTPPPKPDFIVKGDLSASKSSPQQSSGGTKQNSIIPSSLAELRSRLTPDCTGLTGLANIQISKVTSGQQMIPENGINLRGTSVTLTKVRSEASVMDNVQQAKTAVREAISATMAASSSGKGKKKKKKGNGTRQNGDDWNLVESVFTPKDIDLEDGEMDDAERELEAFKRFCLQSVPPARKEKVNLNIKDIVLKKKSTTATVIAAN